MAHSRSRSFESSPSDEKTTAVIEPLPPSRIRSSPGEWPRPSSTAKSEPDSWLDLQVEYDVEGESLTARERCTVCALGGDPIFYRPQMALHCLFQAAEQQPPSLSSTPEKPRQAIPAELKPYGTLYKSKDNAPLWTMTEKDWCAMVFHHHPDNQIVTLTTASSIFSFEWQKETFHWRVKPHYATSTYELCCFRDTKLIATAMAHRLVLWPLDKAGAAHTNPFRSLPARLSSQTSSLPSDSQPSPAADDPLASFLVLSGLLIHDHLASLLKSLGGGPDALKLIADPELDHEDGRSCRGSMASTSRDSGLIVDHHDMMSINPMYGDPRGQRRWLAAGSIQSIELEPDLCLLRSWPCCGYGGWFDRLRIKYWGWTKHHRPRRRGGAGGGWQQQYY